MNTLTSPMQAAELLISLAEVQSEIEAAKAQLQQLLVESASIPKSSDDTVAAEIAKAVRQESVRVNLQGIRSAVSVLESREKEIRTQLAATQETERAQQAEADTKAAIAEMKKLAAKLDKRTAALRETINEMKAVEQQHGATFRKHLAAIKRAERPNYEEIFKFPMDKLLKIEDLRLPVLRQDNGIGGDILWYGNAFVMTSEVQPRD